jgi:hypothetical protein
MPCDSEVGWSGVMGSDGLLEEYCFLSVYVEGERVQWSKGRQLI